MTRKTVPKTNPDEILRAQPDETLLNMFSSFNGALLFSCCCLKCGSFVLNWKIHKEWHKQFEPNE